MSREIEMAKKSLEILKKQIERDEADFAELKKNNARIIKRKQREYV